ncbi:MAG TPA: hypothetical protein VFK90_05635 [Anaeromyxobacter sp.]|nr:hypothetical protein [Anaeromyxobacter sp.]
MGDFEAVPLEAIEAPAQRISGRLAEVRELASGLVLTAALVVVGTVLVTAALVVGVVGSPLLALAIAYVVVRHRRERRPRELSWKPAAG